MKYPMWKCDNGGLIMTHNRVYDMDLCADCPHCEQMICDGDFNGVNFAAIDSSKYPVIYGDGQWHTKEEMEDLSTVAK